MIDRVRDLAQSLTDALASCKPHEACNTWILMLHAPFDIVKFVDYSLAAALVAYIYRTGRVSLVRELYPRLWRYFWISIGLSALSFLGNVAETYFGGWIYVWTGLNKAVTSVAATAFVILLWHVREDLVLLSKVLVALRTGTRITPESMAILMRQPQPDSEPPALATSAISEKD